jgi:hypothetical protein
MITKLEFDCWKVHPVSEAFFAAMKDIEQYSIECLIGNTNTSETPDDFYRGYVYAVRDILKVDLGEETE